MPICRCLRFGGGTYLRQKASEAASACCCKAGSEPDTSGEPVETWRSLRMVKPERQIKHCAGKMWVGSTPNTIRNLREIGRSRHDDPRWPKRNTMRSASQRQWQICYSNGAVDSICNDNWKGQHTIDNKVNRHLTRKPLSNKAIVPTAVWNAPSSASSHILT